MNIVPVKKKKVEEVVDILRNALVRAEAGEITGIMFVEEEPDGKASYSVAGLEDRFKVSGYLFYALQRLQYDDPK